MKVEKVVCIDATPGPYGPVALVENEIYTVIGMTRRDDGYVLKEVKDPRGDLGGYSVTRFRPVDFGFGDKVLSKIMEKDNVELV